MSYAGLYVGITNIVQKKYIKYLMFLFTTIATLLSTLTIVQYCGYEIKSFALNMKYAAIFANTNYFGYYLTISALCSVGLYILEKKKIFKASFLIMFGIIVIAHIINNSFGSYLGTLGGLVFLFIILWIQSKSLRFNTLVPLLIFVILSIFINYNTGNVEKNFTTLTTDTNQIINRDEERMTAGSGRWPLWINAVKIISEKPILGYGPDNLYLEYGKLGIDFERPHNEFLQYAAYFGIPGLLFYLIILKAIFIQIFRSIRQVNLISTVSLVIVVGYLISSFFGCSVYSVTPYFFIFLGIANRID